MDTNSREKTLHDIIYVLTTEVPECVTDYDEGFKDGILTAIDEIKLRTNEPLQDLDNI